MYFPCRSYQLVSNVRYRIAGYFHRKFSYNYFILKSITQKLKLRNHSTATDSTSLSELYEYLNTKYSNESFVRKFSPTKITRYTVYSLQLQKLYKVCLIFRR